MSSGIFHNIFENPAGGGIERQGREEFRERLERGSPDNFHAFAPLAAARNISGSRPEAANSFTDCLRTAIGITHITRFE